MKEVDTNTVFSNPSHAQRIKKVATYRYLSEFVSQAVRGLNLQCSHKQIEAATIRLMSVDTLNIQQSPKNQNNEAVKPSSSSVTEPTKSAVQQEIKPEIKQFATRIFQLTTFVNKSLLSQGFNLNAQGAKQAIDIVDECIELLIVFRNSAVSTERFGSENQSEKKLLAVCENSVKAVLKNIDQKLEAELEVFSGTKNDLFQCLNNIQNNKNLDKKQLRLLENELEPNFIKVFGLMRTLERRIDLDCVEQVNSDLFVAYHEHLSQLVDKLYVTLSTLENHAKSKYKEFFYFKKMLQVFTSDLSLLLTKCNNHDIKCSSLGGYLYATDQAISASEHAKKIKPLILQKINALNDIESAYTLLQQLNNPTAIPILFDFQLMLRVAMLQHSALLFSSALVGLHEANVSQQSLDPSIPEVLYKDTSIRQEIDEPRLLLESFSGMMNKTIVERFNQDGSCLGIRDLIAMAPDIRAYAILINETIGDFAWQLECLDSQAKQSHYVAQLKTISDLVWNYAFKIAQDTRIKKTTAKNINFKQEATGTKSTEKLSNTSNAIEPKSDYDLKREFEKSLDEAGGEVFDLRKIAPKKNNQNKQFELVKHYLQSSYFTLADSFLKQTSHYSAATISTCLRQELLKAEQFIKTVPGLISHVEQGTSTKNRHALNAVPSLKNKLQAVQEKYAFYKVALQDGNVEKFSRDLIKKTNRPTTDQFLSLIQNDQIATIGQAVLLPSRKQELLYEVKITPKQFETPFFNIQQSNDEGIAVKPPPVYLHVHLDPNQIPEGIKPSDQMGLDKLVQMESACLAAHIKSQYYKNMGKEAENASGEVVYRSPVSWDFIQKLIDILDVV